MYLYDACKFSTTPSLADEVWMFLVLSFLAIAHAVGLKIIKEEYQHNSSAKEIISTV